MPVLVPCHVPRDARGEQTHGTVRTHQPRRRYRAEVQGPATYSSLLSNQKKQRRTRPFTPPLAAPNFLSVERAGAYHDSARVHKKRRNIQPSASWMVARFSFSWWRKREAPCTSPALPAPRCKQESVREVGVQQIDEELPPWTPRSTIEVPHPLVVPDDAPSSAEPSPARPSPAQAPRRWGANMINDPDTAAGFSARKVGLLPWESGSARSDSLDREDGGSELPSPALSPLGVGPRPNAAQFCSVCASLYTTAVCRCSMLAFSHPITRIVSQTSQFPEAAWDPPDVPNKRGRDRAQRALWCTSGEHGAAEASTDAMDAVEATDAVERTAAGADTASPTQLVPHVYVSLCGAGTGVDDDEMYDSVNSVLA